MILQITGTFPTVMAPASSIMAPDKTSKATVEKTVYVRNILRQLYVNQAGCGAKQKVEIGLEVDVLVWLYLTPWAEPTKGRRSPPKGMGRARLGALRTCLLRMPVILSR
jgi:hypothetical protein